jgi:hypothetical protein
MYYDEINGSEFEQDYLDGEDVYSGLGFLGAAKKKAEAAMGPKQKACLAKGGRWEGPEGKKTCVMPQVGTAVSATAEQVAAQQAAEALRKQAEAVAAAAAAKKKAEAAMGPKQKACLAKGGRWEASGEWSRDRKAKMHCVMPGQAITPETPVETPPSKTAEPKVGPRQKACLAKGGRWENKKCVMPGQGITPDQPVEVPGGPPVTQALTSEGYPKPGSFYSGPMPPAPPGGWPPFKGSPGPAQRKCLKQGGQWIGPAGKKWCQLGIGGEVVPPVVETPFGKQPPVVVGPAIQCGSGYVLQGQDCYPVESAPGAGYELVRYGGSKYFQWVYTGKGMAPDGGAGGSVPPWTDWSRRGGGGGGSIQPYPLFDESGQYDYGGVDYGQAPAPLPGPTLEPIDEGLGPLEMSAGAQVYAECDATFNANLPMEYSDKYGPMKVLQVFCKQTGGSASQPGPQQPIEVEEMAQVFAPTEGGF